MVVAGQGKTRWDTRNYYWAVSSDIVYLLLLYKKARQENLTPDQVAILKRLVKGELK